MEIVITMAGLGSRFRTAGYTVPKYQIEVHGKTLFEWSMDSLKGFYKPQNQYIFIVRKDDDAEFFIGNKCQKMGLEKITVIELDAPTDGQATTALLAKAHWRSNEELLVYNIDTYVEAYEMKSEDLRGDGFIPCFNAAGDHWSFVRLDAAGRAVEVREKERISDNCTVGAYFFKSCALYEQLYMDYYCDGHTENHEKYIAPLYNLLIEQGGAVYISQLNQRKVHVLGTPEELEKFKKQDITVIS